MAAKKQEPPHLDVQEALRLLDDSRSRVRTAIWALHGMHQDLQALTVEDLSDLEHLLTEMLETALTPAYETLTDAMGPVSGGEVTTH